MKCGCKIEAHWNKDESIGDHIEQCRLCKAAPEMLEALKEVSDLIDSSDLVRDISNDADKQYFIAQGLRITRGMASMLGAIKNATP